VSPVGSIHSMNETSAPVSFQSSNIDIAIRIGLLALIGYLSWKVIGPFLTVALWSAILAVALYPLFDWLVRQLGNHRLAATLITLLCLTIVVGPLTWLGFVLIGDVGYLVRALDAGLLSIPLPAESVKSWPLIGERVHQLWSLAANNIKALLTELAPTLKPVGGKLLEITQGVVLGLLEFVAAIVIAGFLYTSGPRLVESIRIFLRRIIVSHRGEEIVQLVGSTIRNVSHGVVGVALVQSFLAGVGFLVAGIPAAGLLTFLVLLLGIVQVGPTLLIIPIVIWSWMTMEATSALMFTAYMVPVNLVDNILRPIVMARGLITPMPVILIGVMGGLIAYGLAGLFVGPVVLAVAWTLIVAWVYEDNTTPTPGQVEAINTSDSSGSG
jgi:predicted PurR-regulated permease PerM